MTDAPTPAEPRPVPSPGSIAALAAGCTCPVLDNCFGKYPPYPPDDWIFTVGCPVHDSLKATGTGD
jgi:hypothetical protein